MRIIALLAVALAAMACDADNFAYDVDADAAAPPSEAFDHPDECGSCHRRQYAEWRGSMMRYGAISPVFNAFELTVAKQTNGHFAANGPAPNFCNECHSPIAVYEDQFPDFTDDASATPMRDHLDPVAAEGISCDFCHSVRGPDHGKSQLGDGIANVSLVFGPEGDMIGPFAQPSASAFHGPPAQSDFLRSPRFCGSCHDVRPPVDDVLTGASFQRLENLFTEWETSPYNRPEDPVTCQDCHMSLFPWQPAGTYPTGKAVSVWNGEPPPDRRVAPHYFTAVSYALIEDFPGQDDPTLDGFGMPKGQKQRREAFLRAACAITLAATPDTVSGDLLPVRLTVENVGAGHNVPAGFSQERQVWVELTVADARGVVLYRSGHLQDSAHPETGEDAPDGRLDDEDLQDERVVIDPHTFEVIAHEPGPDADQRPFARLGLVNFQNRFLGLNEQGELEPVHAAHLADAIDNTRSIAPKEAREVGWDVPLPDDAVGPITVTARLRYRTFPPLFLRALAVMEPELVDEALIDRNEIVDMAEDERVIQLAR